MEETCQFSLNARDVYVLHSVQADPGGPPRLLLHRFLRHCCQAWKLTIHIYLAPRSRMSGAMLPLRHTRRQQELLLYTAVCINMCNKFQCQLDRLRFPGTAAALCFCLSLFCFGSSLSTPSDDRWQSNEFNKGHQTEMAARNCAWE